MIEDILLRHSASRNIHRLRRYLPGHFCKQAADAILTHPGKVLITTGFWVAGTCETDGPVGAIVLADALQTLGATPVFVTDLFCADILRQLRPFRVLDFPIAPHDESQQIARTMLSHEAPALLVSIERCGMAADGKYYNMRRLDVSEHTAKIDYLFQDCLASIGIGDGGNEIGMGNLVDAIQAEDLPIYPCVTTVRYPVIATVSNWAAYGIVAYLSHAQEQPALLDLIEVRPILEGLVGLGVVDGVTKRTELSVDGFPLIEIEDIVADIRRAATHQ